MLTDFFLLQTFFFTYLIYSQKKLGGGIGCHISIFLIFIELAQISSFVQQSTRLKGTFCKKMQQASTSIGAKEMYTS